MDTKRPDTGRTVQLMGGSRSTTVPPLPDGHERWSLNFTHFSDACAKYDNWTRWFDLHPLPHIFSKRLRAFEWYSEQTKPIVLWEVNPVIPFSCAYPREAIQAHFAVNSTPERYFLSSLDWMLALAIYEEFRHIDIYNFRLSTNAKYFFQLASAMYWISRARGLGISVLVHGDSNLRPQNKLYGIESVNPIDMMPETYE